MLKADIVGTWKLLSAKFQNDAEETIYPLGENPFGRLMYDAIGNVSVFLMKRRRPKFSTEDWTGGTPEEIVEAFQGFNAYCGTYEIDLDKETIIHHIEGSRIPNREGTSQRRFFKLTGNRLTLKTPPVLIRGENGIATLVWERMF